MVLEPSIRDGTRLVGQTPTTRARIGRMFTDFILRNAKEKDLTTTLYEGRRTLSTPRKYTGARRQRKRKEIQD